MSQLILNTRPLMLSRRSFLRNSALTLGGAALALPALAKECKLTEPEILGPMYNFGAPYQAKIADDSEPGQKLMLRGTVYSNDCKTALPNTMIEIWQANDAGAYDKKEPGNFSENLKPHLRGILMTDAKGRYEIETIIPGAYPIPPGIPGLEKFAGLTRARHIHMRVQPALHIPVTTQLYFVGDKYLATDPWGKSKPSLVIDPKQNGKYMTAEFDFVISSGMQG